MRLPRLLLLAAAHLCCAGFVSHAALAAGAPNAWSDLWRTPDQQGQALLDAGQPAQAAERFHDPRRRAYAELRAGRYQEAAKTLAPFNDTESEYNRGNALAESGQLQMALAAYDAALEQSPADKDIRHNRDLVARALHRQQQSQQSSGSSGSQGGQGGKRGKRGQGAGSSGRQQSAGQQGGSGSQQPGSAGQRGNAQTSQAAGAQAGAYGSQPGAYQQGNSPTDPNSYTSSKEGPGQARSDAAFAAAMARKQQQRGGPGSTAQGQAGRAATPERAREGASKAPDSGGLLAGGTQTPRQKPESEQQLALDQWLRQIPDSPAGLLQRKFLIEHMMKQQEGDAPQENGTQQGSGP